MSMNGSYITVHIGNIGHKKFRTQKLETAYSVLCTNGRNKQQCYGELLRILPEGLKRKQIQNSNIWSESHIRRSVDSFLLEVSFLFFFIALSTCM